MFGTVGVTDSITVTPPPDTVSWSQLSVTKNYSHVCELDGSSTINHYTASWTGRVMSGAPDDYEVEGRTGSGIDDMLGDYIEGRFTHESCEFETWGDWCWELTAQGTFVEVSHEGMGFVDDVCIGEVDPETWEIIGSCE